MKIGRMKRSLMAMMLMCLLVVPAMAQKNIEKVVKELEKRTDVAINSVTKRDPKTRKIVSMTKTYSVVDQRMVGVLLEAFEKDEEFAITATKNLPKGRMDSSKMNLYFIFYPQENEKHIYTLTCSGNGQLNLTIIVKQEKGKSDVSSMDFEFNNLEMQANLAFVTQKVKDQLGCIESKNKEMDEK